MPGRVDVERIARKSAQRPRASMVRFWNHILDAVNGCLQLLIGAIVGYDRSSLWILIIA